MGYSKITSVIFDVDGVLTDGTFFYSVEGKILKRFGSHDAPAIKKCKSIFNLQLISADEKGFEISKLRADHLGLPITLVLEDLRSDWIAKNFTREETALVVDSFTDIPSLINVARSFAPNNAHPELLKRENFKALLLWLQDELWSPTKVNIDKNLQEFYIEKTSSRINLLGSKKAEQSYNPRVINGIEVQTWKYYYEKINWGLLTQNSNPSFIHGDLQFDNIIYEESTNKFTLIDWRYDFSGLGSTGDLYYDFAKMLGGIYLNYQEIKKGNFGFSYQNGEVVLDVPSLPDAQELVSILETCAQNFDLDIDKLHALVPLIFWNMAPLHKEPFSNLCWCLGIMHYENLNK